MKNCSSMPIVLVGKTCSGKSTYAKALEDMTNCKRIVTYTTRKPRENEVDGIDYHFIDKDEFLKKCQNGFFAEMAAYDTVNGRVYYGSCVEDYKDNTVIILNPYGLKQIKRLGIKCIAIYIDCPRRIIKKRTALRKDNKKEFRRRYKADKKDFQNIEELVDYTYPVNKKSNIDSFMWFLRYNDLIKE